MYVNLVDYLTPYSHDLFVCLQIKHLLNHKYKIGFHHVGIISNNISTKWLKKVFERTCLVHCPV